ncbi:MULTISPECIES: malonic semialdehyde reductase [Sphingomonas]|uniref:3-hydroxypropanoate dehydrogenase n=1 Tax=Sphingomonas leidyi TaxID=68569 RepID=A0A7X5ZXA4_9SPHN|nr:MULTISPECIES: malonic semialdehyde reductase [Sphingomonas]MBN8812247.1 malonic semialdehyde reductase [Sphingomonas sp.]NIJ67032.1 3-hydroxypropanoate dehydrogenase [Sphingomonas leidyi]OJY47951.1 MAG: malonic semialdehyde reductase [Sphingomonas sp. 67-41]
MAQPLDDAALDTIFRTARTYNGYTDAPVTQADIRDIYGLLKMGPTSANNQAARFVWLTTPEARERLAALSSSTNADKIRKAPAAVIIGMDLAFNEQLPWLFPHAPTAKDWFPTEESRYTTAFRNSSLQGAYLLIAARALGFDTGPMSGFDNAKVDEAFFADQPNVKSNFISTLGHGDPSTIFDRLPRPEFEQFNRVL